MLAELGGRWAGAGRGAAAGSRAAGRGAVSQAAGAWPAVGTAPTLTDLSCERAARANSNAGKFNSPWIIAACCFTA